MNTSFSSECDTRTYHPSCPGCLNYLGYSNTKNSDSKWDIVALPECKHMLHRGCLDRWSSHSRQLAKRDVSIFDGPTCPLCKVEVNPDQASQLVTLWCMSNHEASHDTEPKSDLPLPFSESRNFDHHCDVQALQAIFDQAVSADFSDFYFTVSNFPALHQMKNRYGIALSAEQLDTIMNQALHTTWFNHRMETINSSAMNKIKMAMLLGSDDEASKEVINKFFMKILGKTGDGKEDAIAFLLEQGVLEKEALQKCFEYYLRKESFREAANIHEKYGLHIDHETLKQSLMQVRGKDDLHQLSRMAGNENFQQAVLEALKALNETIISQDIHLRTRDAINTLLSVGIQDQDEINKSLCLAVLFKDRSWQDQLKEKYGAVLEPIFLKNLLEGTRDSNLVETIKDLLNLRADDELSKEALLAALLRVTTVNDPYGFYRIKHLLTACLENGIWSQQLVNKALKQALDNNNQEWAVTLNKKFQAVIDPQSLEDYLLKILTNPPSSGMGISNLRNLVLCFNRALSFVDKKNEQYKDAVATVLNRLLDGNLSQMPVYQECIELLVNFNDTATS
ncbi:hypothetical protein [Endozoicomonas sp. SCSIO W0465]|uniref:hypothetical protein n=1 Tax=Endozoicomonas sp. SCSIO W0465 TaxID=2918516 RepID=UPI0020752921|nr:hypothetical protein [Endozoicomonas sp. SCSIO W0465]USE34290.1 hypothetical protein MJO57_19280 [Endozoicomonas sp. SCSIO W0465]